ncbi:MAG: ABC transporter substrate-binding protein [Nitrosomonas sp.]|nr:ABC transporter substrate-binding protein [Nitrosomonas sp.]
MIKNVFYFLMMIVMLLDTTSILAQSDEPIPSNEPQHVVAVLQNALIEAMRQGGKMRHEDRESFLAPVILETHDLATIVRTTLGAHWPTLDKTQQQSMLKTFAQHSIATYASRFNQYGGEQFEIMDNQPLPRERILVRSQFIKADKGIISFDYVLHQQNGHWLIINIVVDGVSDLALKRAEYNAIMQQEGIQSLIDTLQHKTDQIKLEHQQ